MEQELSGYETIDQLPDYRIINTITCIGKWTNGYRSVTNWQVPLWKIPDEELTKLLTTFYAYEGIRTIEAHAKNKELKFVLPLAVTTMVNKYVGEQGFSYIQLEYAVNHETFEQILDTIKNRLLEFVLKLDEKWNLELDKPTDDQLSDLFSVVIYNIQQGGNMSVFDQRGQKVNYQYNAAGNININSIQGIRY